MPVVNPRVPEGLRDLMKGLTKEVLREKPPNIYEFSAHYFETLLQENKHFIVKEYEPAISYENLFQAKERNQIPVAVVFKIIPEGLTELIKEFIKAVLRENPKNLCEFAVNYFRHIQKVGNIKNDTIQYAAYENYFNSKERFVFTPYVKCTCGRTFGEGLAQGKEINKNQIKKKDIQNGKAKLPLQKTLPKISAVSAIKSESTKDDYAIQSKTSNDEPPSLKLLHSVETESIEIIKTYDERYVTAIYIIQRFFKRCLKKQSLKAPKDELSTQNGESSIHTTQMSEETAAIIIQRSLRKLFTEKSHKNDNGGIPIVPHLENIHHLDEHNDNVSEAASYTSASTVQMSAESAGETTEREILEIGTIVSEEQAVIHTIEEGVEQQNDSAVEPKKKSDKITNSSEVKLNKHEVVDKTGGPLIIGQLESQIVESNKMESLDENDEDKIENNASGEKRDSLQLHQQLTRENNNENLKIVQEIDIGTNDVNTLNTVENHQNHDNEKNVENEEPKAKSFDEQDDTHNSEVVNDIKEFVKNDLTNFQDHDKKITDTDDIDDQSKVNEINEKEARTVVTTTEQQSSELLENDSKVEAKDFEEQVPRQSSQENVVSNADGNKLVAQEEMENIMPEAKSDSIEENLSVIKTTEDETKDTKSEKTVENVQTVETAEFQAKQSEMSAANYQNIVQVNETIPVEKFNSEPQKEAKYADNASIEELANVIKDRFFNVTSEEIQLKEQVTEEPNDNESEIENVATVEKEHEHVISKQNMEKLMTTDEKTKATNEKVEQNIPNISGTPEAENTILNDTELQLQEQTDTVTVSGENTAGINETVIQLHQQNIKSLSQDIAEDAEKIDLKTSFTASPEENNTNNSKETEENITKEIVLINDEDDDIKAAVKTEKENPSSSNNASEFKDQPMAVALENGDQENEISQDQKHINDKISPNKISETNVGALEVLEQKIKTEDNNETVNKNDDQSAKTEENGIVAKVTSSLEEIHNLENMNKHNGDSSEFSETEEHKIVDAELLPIENSDESQNFGNSNSSKGLSENMAGNESNDLQNVAEAEEIDNLKPNDLKEKTASETHHSAKEALNEVVENLDEQTNMRQSNDSETAIADTINNKDAEENHLAKDLVQTTSEPNHVKTSEIRNADSKEDANVDGTADNLLENNKLDKPNAMTEMQISVSKIEHSSEGGTSRVRRDVDVTVIQPEEKLLTEEVAKKESDEKMPEKVSHDDNTQDVTTSHTSLSKLSSNDTLEKLDPKNDIEKSNSSSTDKDNAEECKNSEEISSNRESLGDNTKVGSIEVVSQPNTLDSLKLQAASNIENSLVKLTEQIMIQEEKPELQQTGDSVNIEESKHNTIHVDKVTEINKEGNELKPTADNEELNNDEKQVLKDDMVSSGQKIENNIVSQNVDTEKELKSVSKAVSTSEADGNDGVKEPTNIIELTAELENIAKSADELQKAYCKETIDTNKSEDPTNFAMKSENTIEIADSLQKITNNEELQKAISKDTNKPMDPIYLATKTENITESEHSLHKTDDNKNLDVMAYDTSTATPNSFDIGTQNSHESKNEKDINSASSKQVKVGKSKIINNSSNFKNTKKSSFITGQQHEPLFAEIHLKSFNRPNLLDSATLKEKQQQQQQKAEENEQKPFESALEHGGTIDKTVDSGDTNVLHLNLVEPNEIENQSEAAVKPQEKERTATYLYGIHTPRDTPTLGRKNSQKMAITFTIPSDDNRAKKPTQTRQLEEQVALENSNDNAASNDKEKTEKANQGQTEVKDKSVNDLSAVYSNDAEKYEYSKLNELNKNLLENEPNAENEIELESPTELFAELNIIEGKELDATITAEEAEILKKLNVNDVDRSDADNTLSTPNGILRTIVEINESELPPHTENKITSEQSHKQNMISISSEPFDPLEFGSNSDNESDLTSSWTCSKETDENVFSDEFLNENTNDDDDHYRRRRSSVITTGNDALEGGIYEMDPNSSVLTNDIESKLEESLHEIANLPNISLENRLDATVESIVSMTAKEKNNAPNRGNKEESSSEIEKTVPKSTEGNRHHTEIQPHLHLPVSENNSSNADSRISQAFPTKNLAEAKEVEAKANLGESNEKLKLEIGNTSSDNEYFKGPAKTLDATFTKNISKQEDMKIPDSGNDCVKTTQEEETNTRPQTATEDQQSTLDSINISSNNFQSYEEKENKINITKRNDKILTNAKDDINELAQLEKDLVQVPDQSIKFHANYEHNNLSSENKNEDNESEKLLKNNEKQHPESAKALSTEIINANNFNEIKREVYSNSKPNTNKEISDIGVSKHKLEHEKSASPIESQVIEEQLVKPSNDDKLEIPAISGNVTTTDENIINSKETTNQLETIFTKNTTNSADEAFADTKDDNGQLTHFWEQVSSTPNQLEAQSTTVFPNKINNNSKANVSTDNNVLLQKSQDEKENNLSLIRSKSSNLVQADKLMDKISDPNISQADPHSSIDYKNNRNVNEKLEDPANTFTEITSTPNTSSETTNHAPIDRSNKSLTDMLSTTSATKSEADKCQDAKAEIVVEQSKKTKMVEKLETSKLKAAEIKFHDKENLKVAAMDATFTKNISTPKNGELKHETASFEKLLSPVNSSPLHESMKLTSNNHKSRDEENSTKTSKSEIEKPQNVETQLVESRKILENLNDAEMKFDDENKFKDTVKLLDVTFTKNISTPKSAELKHEEFEELVPMTNNSSLDESMKLTSNNNESRGEENSTKASKPELEKSQNVEAHVVEEQSKKSKVHEKFETPNLTDAEVKFDDKESSIDTTKVLDANFTKNILTPKSAKIKHEELASLTNNALLDESTKLATNNNNSLDEEKSFKASKPEVEEPHSIKLTSNNSTLEDNENSTNVVTQIIKEQSKRTKTPENFETPNLTDAKIKFDDKEYSKDTAKVLNATFTKNISTPKNVEIKHETVVFEKLVSPTNDLPLNESMKSASNNNKSRDEENSMKASKPEVEKPQNVETQVVEKQSKMSKNLETTNSIDAEIQFDNKENLKGTAMDASFTKNISELVPPINNSPLDESMKLASSNNKSREVENNTKASNTEKEKPQNVDEMLKLTDAETKFDVKDNLKDITKVLEDTFAKNISTPKSAVLKGEKLILKESISPDEVNRTNASEPEIKRPQDIEAQLIGEQFNETNAKTKGILDETSTDIHADINKLEAPISSTSHLTTNQLTNLSSNELNNKLSNEDLKEFSQESQLLQSKPSNSNQNTERESISAEEMENSQKSSNSEDTMDNLNILLSDVNENLSKAAKSFDESFVNSSQEHLEFVEKAITDLKADAIKLTELEELMRQAPSPPSSEPSDDQLSDNPEYKDMAATTIQKYYKGYRVRQLNKANEKPKESKIENKDERNTTKAENLELLDKTSNDSQDDIIRLEAKVPSRKELPMDQPIKLLSSEDNEEKIIQETATVDSSQITKNEHEIIMDKARAAFIIQKAYRKYIRINSKNPYENQENIDPKENTKKDLENANKLVNAAQIIQKAYKKYKAHKMNNEPQKEIPDIKYTISSEDIGSTTENSLDESQITVIFNEQDQQELNVAKSEASLSTMTSSLSDNQIENHTYDHITKKRSIEYMAPTAPPLEDHIDLHEESEKVNWFVGEEPIVRSAPVLNITDALITDNAQVVVETSHNLLTSTSKDACNNSNEPNSKVEPAKSSSVTFVQAKLVDSTSSLFEPDKQLLSNISTLKSSDEIVSAAAENSKSVPQESVSNSLNALEEQNLAPDTVNGKGRADNKRTESLPEDMSIEEDSKKTSAGKFLIDIDGGKGIAEESKDIDGTKDLGTVEIPGPKADSLSNNYQTEKSVTKEVAGEDATDDIKNKENTADLHKTVNGKSKQEMEQLLSSVVEDSYHFEDWSAGDSFDNSKEMKQEVKSEAGITDSNKVIVAHITDFLKTERDTSNSDKDQTNLNENDDSTATINIKSNNTLVDIENLTQFINLERKYWESDIPYIKLEEPCTKKNVYLVEPVEGDATQADDVPRSESSLSALPTADLDPDTEQSSTDSLESMTKKLHDADVAIEKMQLRRASTARSNSNDDGKSAHELSFDEPVIKSMQELQENRSSELEDEEAAVILNRLQREDTRESSAQSDAVVFGENNSPESHFKYEFEDSPMMKISLQRVHTIAGDDPKSLFKSVTIDDTVQYIEPPECDTTATSGSSFCLDDDVSENIRKKMMAYSLSEADSDFFDNDTGDVTTRMGKQKLHKDDFNISTALVDLAGTSTDTESTIVSAATKIQAGARGFLTRKRLRRTSGGTKSTLPDNSKASFGNAAISESLERLIEEEAAKKIQHAYRKHYRQKDLKTSTAGDNSMDKRQKTNADDEEDAHVLLSFESTLAARRLTLQRGDALRNDSTPDEDNGNGNIKPLGNISNESDKESKQQTSNDVEQSVDKSSGTEGSSLENNSMHTYPRSEEIASSESIEDEQIVKSHQITPGPSVDANIEVGKTVDTLEKSSTSALTADANNKNKIDNELKWISLRQNSMPVQIEESEVFRVIPKHMRKRIKSAESQKKKRLRVLKD